MLIELGLLSILFLCALTRKSHVIFGCLLLLMLLLMVFSTENADMAAYMGRYSRIASISDLSGTDVGFKAVMLLSKRLGLSYAGFLLLVYCIGAAIIVRVMFRNSDYPCVQLATYFLMFFYIHSIQIRAFIAEWLVVQALHDLISERGGARFYIVQIIIASLFHYEALFFLLALVPYRVTDNKAAYLSIIVIGLIAPFVYSRVQLFIPDDLQTRVSYYMNSDLHRRTMGGIVFIVLLMGLTFVMYQMTVKRDNKHILGEQEKLNSLYRINMLNLITIILIFFYNNNFYRFSRPIIIVDIMVLIDCLIKSMDGRTNKATGWLITGIPIAFIASELITATWISAIATNSFFSHFI